MMISATNTNTGDYYPIRTYVFYSLREAKKMYKEEYGLRYKKGIKFYFYN